MHEMFFKEGLIFIPGGEKIKKMFEVVENFTRDSLPRICPDAQKRGHATAV